MRRSMSLVIFLAAWSAVSLFYPVGPARAFPGEQPHLTAASAVLLEAATGQVLYQKEAHRRRPPASTTKVMTALLALKMGDPGEMVQASPRAGATEGSSIYLEAGDQVPLGELVRGTLIRSGNDAAVAIAEHLAGSLDGFALLMNREARLQGALETHFTNPNGLPAAGHYSSAYDLAVMARAAMQVPFFREAVSTKEALLKSPLGGWSRRVANTNSLLWFYSGADGVKTGTTVAAGKCLIASASRGGRRILAVVLKSGDRFGDAARLLDYGFASFRLLERPAGQAAGTVKVEGGELPRVQAVLAEPFSFALPLKDLPELKERAVLPAVVPAPLAQGTPLGVLRLESRGEVLAEFPLVAETTSRRLPLIKKWLFFMDKQ